MLGLLRSIWHELPGLISDRVELLSLELRRAGIVLLQLVALTVAAAILAVTAWLVLWAGVVLLLVDAGLNPTVVLAGTVLINAAVAAWAVWRMQRLLPLLQLPATRRHLMLGPTAPAPAAAAAPERGQEHDELVAAGSAAAR